jgi:hypothetical protein
MQQQNFVFGYGSLICRHSRATTVASGSEVVAMPVQVRVLCVDSYSLCHGLEVVLCYTY